DFFQFVNLDDDPELEMYCGSGYADGIDYALYDLDLEAGQMEILFYFNPVIIQDESNFWGYPWDTEGIITSVEAGKVRVYFSVDHDIQREGEITIPENQEILPVIFLLGNSTQPEIEVAEIRNSTWKTLKDVKDLVRI
ncbi:MAG: hypothetical protein AAGI38_16550, partial [Bacteroidota bacterium]